MTDRINAEITATDNASPKFKQVAQSAQQMDQAVEKSASSATRFNGAAFAMGAALGSLSGLMSDAARANAEAEASQTRLQASIESTGHFYEEYADQLEAAGEAALQMGFDDEDAADSISTLTQVTQDTGQAIQDLSLVMDIARARHIDLAAATKIVVAAENERYGQLARLGIMIDENATREEALAALRQRYSGQAAAYAQTEAAEVDRLSNAYENALEAVGGYTGQAQTLLMILPGLSAGFVGLSAAIGGATAKLTGGAGLTAGLARLAPILAGPVGLAALFAGVAVALEKTGQKQQAIFETSTADLDDYRNGIDQLRITVGELARGNDQALTDMGNQAGTMVSRLESDMARVSQLSNLIDQSDDNTDPSALRQWKEEFADITEQYQLFESTVSGGYQPLQSIAGNINTILRDTGVGAKDAQADLQTLMDEVQSGAITWPQFATGVDMVVSSLDAYDAMAGDAARSTGELTKGIEAAADAMTYQLGEATALDEYFAAEIEKASAALEAQFNLTAAAYRGTTDALEAGFRTAVGNTNAIAQQSQAVADWAENLIAAQGAWSELDNLVAEGRITGESGQFGDPSQYAAAQRAYNSILEDNAEIQRDILAIQAMQAPTIAAMVNEQQKYIEGLRTGTAEEQMRALAYMDSATASQALSLAQGYLENQDVFGPMIEQAAALNPYLALILEDMGIIERGSQGEITLTGADTAKSELDILTAAIEQLVQAQWVASFDGDVSAAEAAYERATGMAVDWDNTETNATAGLDDEASAPIAGIASDLNVLGATSVSPTVSVNDNASGTLSNISSLLWGLQDRTVTVTTINNAINPFARLGGVMHYAGGGVVAGMGETGDEDLFYPNGSVGRTNGPGFYDVPVGTYVRPAPASRVSDRGITIQINVAGSVMTEGDLAAAVAGPIAAAVVDLLDDMELSEPR